MKTLASSLTLCVVTLTLAACGSSNNKSYTPVGTSPTPTASPTTSPTSAPTPTGTETPTTPTPTNAPATNPTPTATANPTPTAAPTTAPSTSPTPTAVPTPTPGPLAGRVDSGVPAGATVVVEAGPSCIACGVNNETAVLDIDWDNFATASLQVGLLAAGGVGELTVTVNLAQAIDPTVSITTPLGGTAFPDQPGFVVSFPDAALLTLSLFPAIEIAALKDGEAVATTTYTYGALNLIGLATFLNDINNAPVYLGLSADDAVTVPYNAIRVAFTASVADVLLAIDLHQVAIAGVTGDVSGDLPAPPIP